MMTLSAKQQQQPTQPHPLAAHQATAKLATPGATSLVARSKPINQKQSIKHKSLIPTWRQQQNKSTSAQTTSKQAAKGPTSNTIMKSQDSEPMLISEHKVFKQPKRRSLSLITTARHNSTAGEPESNALRRVGKLVQRFGSQFNSMMTITATGNAKLDALVVGCGLAQARLSQKQSHSANDLSSLLVLGNASEWRKLEDDDCCRLVVSSGDESEQPLLQDAKLSSSKDTNNNNETHKSQAEAQVESSESCSTMSKNNETPSGWKPQATGHSSDCCATANKSSSVGRSNALQEATSSSNQKSDQPEETSQDEDETKQEAEGPRKQHEQEAMKRSQEDQEASKQNNSEQDKSILVSQSDLRASQVSVVHQPSSSSSSIRVRALDEPEPGVNQIGRGAMSLQVHESSSGQYRANLRLLDSKQEAQEAVEETSKVSQEVEQVAQQAPMSINLQDGENCSNEAKVVANQDEKKTSSADDCKTPKATSKAAFFCAECRLSLAGRHFMMVEAGRRPRQHQSQAPDTNQDTKKKHQQIVSANEDIKSSKQQEDKTMSKEPRPHCLDCYDKLFGDTCHTCRKLICCDFGAIIHGTRRWHAAGSCFKCKRCATSLLERPFCSSSEGDIYCSSECARLDQFARSASIYMQKNKIKPVSNTPVPIKDNTSNQNCQQHPIDSQLASNFNYLLKNQREQQQQHSSYGINPINNKQRSLTLDARFGRALSLSSNQQIYQNHLPPPTQKQAMYQSPASKVSLPASEQLIESLSDSKRTTRLSSNPFLIDQQQKSLAISQDGVYNGSSKYCTMTRPLMQQTRHLLQQRQTNHRSNNDHYANNYINLDCVFDSASKPDLRNQADVKTMAGGLQKLIRQADEDKCDNKPKIAQQEAATTEASKVVVKGPRCNALADCFEPPVTSQCSPAASVASNEGAQSDHSGDSRSSGIHSCSGPGASTSSIQGDHSGSQCCSSTSSTSSRSSVSSAASSTISSGGGGANSNQAAAVEVTNDATAVPASQEMSAPSAQASSSLHSRQASCQSVAASLERRRRVQPITELSVAADCFLYDSQQSKSTAKDNAIATTTPTTDPFEQIVKHFASQRSQQLQQQQAQLLPPPPPPAPVDALYKGVAQQPIASFRQHHNSASQASNRTSQSDAFFSELAQRLPRRHQPQQQQGAGCPSSSSSSPAVAAAITANAGLLHSPAIMLVPQSNATTTTMLPLDTNGLPTVDDDDDEQSPSTRGDNTTTTNNNHSSCQTTAASSGAAAGVTQSNCHYSTVNKLTKRQAPAAAAPKEAAPPKAPAASIKQVPSEVSSDSDQLRQTFFALTSPLLAYQAPSQSQPPMDTATAAPTVAGEQHDELDSFAPHEQMSQREQPPLSLYGLAERLQQAGSQLQLHQRQESNTSQPDTLTRPTKSVSFDPNVKDPPSSSSPAIRPAGLKSALKSGSNSRRRELELAQQLEWEYQQQQQLAIQQQFLLKSSASNIPPAYSAHYDQNGRRIRLSSLLVNQQLQQQHQLALEGGFELPPRTMELAACHPDGATQQQQQPQPSLGRSLLSDALAKLSLGSSSSRGGRRQERNQATQVKGVITQQPDAALHLAPNPLIHAMVMDPQFQQQQAMMQPVASTSSGFAGPNNQLAAEQAMAASSYGHHRHRHQGHLSRDNHHHHHRHHKSSSSSATSRRDHHRRPSRSTCSTSSSTSSSRRARRSKQSSSEHKYEHRRARKSTSRRQRRSQSTRPRQGKRNRSRPVDDVDAYDSDSSLASSSSGSSQCSSASSASSSCSTCCSDSDTSFYSDDDDRSSVDSYDSYDSNVEDSYDSSSSLSDNEYDSDDESYDSQEDSDHEQRRSVTKHQSSRNGKNGSRGHRSSSGARRREPSSGSSSRRRSSTSSSTSSSRRRRHRASKRQRHDSTTQSNPSRRHSSNRPRQQHQPITPSGNSLASNSLCISSPNLHQHQSAGLLVPAPTLGLMPTDQRAANHLSRSKSPSSLSLDSAKAAGQQSGENCRII